MCVVIKRSGDFMEWPSDLEPRSCRQDALRDWMQPQHKGAQIGTSDVADDVLTGITPNPQAFVEVLFVLASTRHSNLRVVGTFIHDLADGGQAELTWLKGLILCTQLSISHVETPAGFASPLGNVLHGDLADVLERLRDGDSDKEWLKSLAMTALTASSGCTSPCRCDAKRTGTSDDPAGAPLSLQVGRPPFVRLLAGFDKDTWCAPIACTAEAAMPDNPRHRTEGEPLIQRLFNQIASGGASDLDWLTKFVWELALTRSGTYILQRAVEVCNPDTKKVVLSALCGNVWAACTSPHANYTLQVCMTKLPADMWRDFILRELEGHFGEAAKHVFGCRVLQRLIEHIGPKDLAPLVKEVITNHAVLRDVVHHKFGNYVVQHVLEYDTEAGMQQHRVVEEMCRVDEERSLSIYELAKHRVASNVVDQALTYCRPECWALLVEALLADETEMQNLRSCQYGSFVFKHLQKVLKQALVPKKVNNRSNDWCQRNSLLLKVLMRNAETVPSLKLGKEALFITTDQGLPLQVQRAAEQDDHQWERCDHQAASASHEGSGKPSGRRRRRKKTASCKEESNESMPS
jgi:hypothetical protein